jgi:hypothetical protein
MKPKKKAQKLKRNYDNATLNLFYFFRNREKFVHFLPPLAIVRLDLITSEKLRPDFSDRLVKSKRI